MLPTILVIIVIVIVGVSVLAYRSRTERGIESGISSFRRELRALAPRPGEVERPPSPERDPKGSSGVGIVPPDDTLDPADGGDDDAEHDPGRDPGGDPER